MKLLKELMEADNSSTKYIIKNVNPKLAPKGVGDYIEWSRFVYVSAGGLMLRGSPKIASAKKFSRERDAKALLDKANEAIKTRFPESNATAKEKKEFAKFKPKLKIITVNQNLKENQERAEKEHMDDLALKELGKIEDDASYYFQKKSNQLKVLTQEVRKLSDAEFGELASHPAIVKSIQDNYDYADDTGSTSSISMSAIFKAMGME